jgi:hypothetical protein
MTPDTNPTAPAPGDTRGFPYVTAVATLAGLFLFFGLVLVVYDSPNFLGEPPGEEQPKPVDPAARLDEVKARNRAVLDGTDPGVKRSLEQATAEVLAGTATTKDDENPHGRLPFPVAKPAAAAPAPKPKE